MQVQQLEAFAAVCKHRSFTRAANELSVTQPAVTRQIHALESEVNSRLFDRRGRVVRLTVSGEAILPYAQSILRLLREAREAVADVEGARAGAISLGASATLAAYVLPPILRSFRQRRPRVSLAIRTGVSASVVGYVRAGDCDLGLVTADPHDDDLAATNLSPYGAIGVTGATRGAPAGDTVGAAELAADDLILMRRGSNLRAYVDRMFAQAGIDARAVLETDNVEAIKRMVEAGLGVSVLPEVAVRAEVMAGRLRTMRLRDAPPTDRAIVLIRRQDGYLTGAHRALIAGIESVLRHD